MFKARYANVSEGPKEWQDIKTSEGMTYEWDATSTYVQNPPYFTDMSKEPGEMSDMYERDEPHYKMFVEKQKTKEGMDEYMKEWLYDLPDHKSLNEKIGKERLQNLTL